MRFTITRQGINTRSIGHEDLGTSPVEKVEVPDRELLKAGGLIGVITGLIGALLPLVSLWLVGEPDARQARDLADRKFFAERLDQAMRVETDGERRTSIRLLLATGLLEAKNAGQLEGLLNGKDAFPQWRASGSTQSSTPTTGPTRTGGTTVDRVDTTTGTPPVRR
jgi:hypothetical protein